MKNESNINKERIGCPGVAVDFLVEETAKAANLLQGFEMTAYRFTMKAEKNGLQLPPYKGATLRGGFGHIFKKICCVQENQNCKTCTQQQSCAYAYIFETSPPEAAQRLRNYDDIPRPFVIEPPNDRKTTYNSGEILTFTLLLFGQASSYLPFFILSFRELGERGLGGRDRKCLLAKIEAVDLSSGSTTEIYNCRDDIIKAQEKPKSLTELMLIPGREFSIGTDKEMNKNSLSLNIHFCTMTRLKHKGKLSRTPEFYILFRNIMRRLSALLYFHGGKALEIDFKRLFKETEKVDLLQNLTSWENWERYSRRQNNRISMGGLVGKAVYAYEARHFLPFLRLGEIIHAGKNTPFGLGKISIEE